MADRNKRRRSALETIEYKRPRCPKCGSPHLRKYRSIRDQGDGTGLAWVRCVHDDCGYQFRLIQL